MRLEIKSFKYPVPRIVSPPAGGPSQQVEVQVDHGSGGTGRTTDSAVWLEQGHPAVRWAVPVWHTYIQCALLRGKRNAAGCDTLTSEAKWANRPS